MSSPWTYLGHLRFEHLCRRFGLTINHKPMDLLKVWSVSSGLPLRERARQRQAYRHQELRRWREFLGIPCNLEPAHHPVADRRACYLAIAAMRQGLDWSRLSYALLRAVWVEDRNIGESQPNRREAGTSATCEGDAARDETSFVYGKEAANRLE
jgi:2-hydroxychromene-2-carboxylate isomerase